MSKAFWSEKKAVVAILGGGSWGTVLAGLASQNCSEVWLWMRDEQGARTVNALRVLPENVRAVSEVDRIFDRGLDAVVWALPSSVTRAQARLLAKYFAGHEIVLHATKGIEPHSLKRMSQVLIEEWPVVRMGVISGPNLATEVAQGLPAATVVASRFNEVLECGCGILNTNRFKVYQSRDLIGVEWGGVLKNVLAIASGVTDAMGLGWNARATLITRGLSEMTRFASTLGASLDTFLGLAGVGDLLATSSSPLSRNYQLGLKLGQGQKYADVIEVLGGVTVEGSATALTISEYAIKNQIVMPITEAVCQLILGQATPDQVLVSLMQRPVTFERS